MRTFEEIKNECEKWDWSNFSQSDKSVLTKGLKELGILRPLHVPGLTENIANRPECKPVNVLSFLRWVREEPPFKVGDVVRVCKTFPGIPHTKAEEYPVWTRSMEEYCNREYEVSLISHKGYLRLQDYNFHTEWCELVKEATETPETPETPHLDWFPEDENLKVNFGSPIETPTPSRQKLKVYISGAIAGKDPEETKRLFDDAKNYLLSHGFEPVSPFDFGDYSKSWSENMMIVLAELVRCQGILMLEGWEQSEGAKIEYMFAKKRDMFVISRAK